MNHDDSGESLQVSDGQLAAAAPDMPSVPAYDLFRGRPRLLLETGGFRHSLGWQERKTGPVFVLARLREYASLKIIQRYPFDEQGWASAWRALSELDPQAAAATAARLAEKEAGRRAVAALAALDAESVSCLRRLTFTGGTSGLPLGIGEHYDLRFLTDRLMICPHSSMASLVEVPFGEVETLEIGGPGKISKTTGEVLALVLSLALLGAIVGLLVLRLLGLLLGAVIFGLIGALVSEASTRTETVVRLRAGDSEFYFLYAEKGPDALRMALSQPLTAIRMARAAQAGAADEPGLAPESVPDQLGKLAALLQQDLITRAEFDHLKAQLLAQSMRA
jgi:hypothetical protein